jgi:uncharacterized membrane protein YidH (DUF202 family)
VRSPDNAVRRAVGASRATVRNAALLEAVAIAAIGAGTGSIVGVGVSRLAVAEWPGGLGGYQAEASVVVVLAIVGVVLASALLPIIFARSGRLTEPDRAPRQIFVPASAQFAASVALLVTAALVAHQGTSTTGLGAVGGNTEVLELRTAAGDRTDLGRRYAALLDRLKADSLTASLTSPGAIAGLGTSGTLMGVGRALRHAGSRARVVAVEPVGHAKQRAQAADHRLILGWQRGELGVLFPRAGAPMVAADQGHQPALARRQP